MGLLKLSSKDYPKVNSLSLGEKVSFTMTGEVQGIEFDSKESIVSVLIDQADFDLQETPKKKEHPVEVMKKMAKLQGMINTPRP